MSKTVANVLVGGATLSIRQPEDALAEFSREQQYAGSYSAKLYKKGTGNAGSTHVQITPPTGKTLTAFVADPTDYSFFYWYSAVTGNFVQFELKFEDPDSDAWVEATVVPHQNTLGTGAWLQKSLALTDVVGFGGVGELGGSFFDWDLGTTISTLITDIDAKDEVTDSGPWLLTRVRLELWEATPERTAYVDSLEIDGTTYTIEPGGTGPAISFGAPYTEIGYTEDGVTITYGSETAPIRVEEETFPIGMRLSGESYEVTVNMAEASLYNLDKSMAGSLLSGSIIRLGGGTIKTMSLKIEATNPAGYTRAIFIPKAVAMGSVGSSYRKDAKTFIPATFQALKPSENEDAVQIVDNVA